MIDAHAALAEWSEAHGYEYARPWYQPAGYVDEGAGYERLYLCRCCGETHTGPPPTACPACGMERS